jgi:hypothetical protein
MSSEGVHSLLRGCLSLPVILLKELCKLQRRQLVLADQPHDAGGNP